MISNNMILYRCKEIRHLIKAPYIFPRKKDNTVHIQVKQFEMGLIQTYFSDWMTKIEIKCNVKKEWNRINP